EHGERSCQTSRAIEKKWCHVSKMEFDTKIAMALEFSGIVNGGQEATVQEALELLIELIGFEPRLFGILMKMLGIVDETAWHTAENEDEDAGE
ncbi:hypothetical protein Tco_0054825, partial [Tanacetum coccineum]